MATCVQKGGRDMDAYTHKGRHERTHLNIHAIYGFTRKIIKTISPSYTHACVSLLLEHIFHFITSLVCDDGDKTVVTEMSEQGGGRGGFKIEREIMYFN